MLKCQLLLQVRGSFAEDLAGVEAQDEQTGDREENTEAELVGSILRIDPSNVEIDSGVRIFSQD